MASSLMMCTKEYVSDSVKKKGRKSITGQYYTVPCSGPRQPQKSDDCWDISHGKQVHCFLSVLLEKA